MEELVRELVASGALKSKAVIDAFTSVRRKDFIPEQYRRYAHVNEPLPIGEGQTISQPLTVAIMTEALQAEKGHKILEVGAGSGYHAAILSLIVGSKDRVITTEIIPGLFEFAKNNLKNYRNVTVLNTDGSQGYAAEAPYDRIIVTASAPDVPKPLLAQLKNGGRMIIPVGDEMHLIEKEGNAIKKTFMGYFAFVPLRGKYGRML
jgi:protein-L-isoaspartate(D-aspartate) O-methyltransferase